MAGPEQQAAEGNLVRELVRILGSALLQLGETGRNDPACELAAKAWSLLRHEHPKEAEYLNGVLHALTAPREKPKPDAEASGREDPPLEVRHLAPAERHERIIRTFEELEPGRAFILINDHDPKPLYYQFAFEYKDQFTWEPIEEGPEVWRVRIGKI